jgi:hypothetical protein
LYCVAGAAVVQILPGELLYTGAKVKVEGRNAKKRTQSIKAEFEAIVRPNPTLLFGL